MSDNPVTDKNITSVPISVPLVLGSGAAAAFFGWMAFGAWSERHQPTFQWWDLAVPGVMCLVALSLFFWAIAPRK